MAYAYNSKGFQPKQQKQPAIFGAFAPQQQPQYGAPQNNAWGNQFGGFGGDQAGAAPAPQAGLQGYGWNFDDPNNAVQRTGTDAQNPWMWMEAFGKENFGKLFQDLIKRTYELNPQNEAFRQQGINALSPGGIKGLLQAFRQQQMGGAQDVGRQNAATLRSQGIQGADASAMLDANNQAADATNQYSQQLNDPRQIAERAMAGMNLTDPSSVMGGVLQILQSLNPAIFNAIGVNDRQHAENAQGGLGGMFGQLLGAAGQYYGAGGGGFGAMGGGGGGGNAWGDLNRVDLSDRRLKANIVRVGTHPLGIGIYEYDLGGKRERGVMADEVARVKPEAVVRGDDGYARVNYGML